MPLSPSLVLSSLSKIGVVKVGWLKKALCLFNFAFFQCNEEWVKREESKGKKQREKKGQIKLNKSTRCSLVFY